MFYTLLKKVLNPDGVAVVQSTSLLWHPKFLVIITRYNPGFTKPYHNILPLVNGAHMQV